MTDQQPTQSEKARRRQERRLAKSQGGGGVFRERFTPRNEKQHTLFMATQRRPVVFALGPAGVGKTYVAGRVAADRLADPRTAVEKVVITRAAVAPKRHALGFLPGKADQKMAPWVVPVFEALKAGLGGGQLDKARQEGRIEVVPFEHMRGRTFDRSFIILDEAQNCCQADLELLITRIGEDSTLVICGDQYQTDIDDSGLLEVADMVERHGLHAQVVRFGEQDVVRSAAAKEWVGAFLAERREAFQAAREDRAKWLHRPPLGAPRAPAAVPLAFVEEAPDVFPAFLGGLAP